MVHLHLSWHIHTRHGTLTLVIAHSRLSWYTHACHDTLTHVTAHSRLSLHTHDCHDALMHVTTHSLLSQHTYTCHNTLTIAMAHLHTSLYTTLIPVKAHSWLSWHTHTCHNTLTPIYWLGCQSVSFVLIGNWRDNFPGENRNAVTCAGGTECYCISAVVQLIQTKPCQLFAETQCDSITAR